MQSQYYTRARTHTHTHTHSANTPAHIVTYALTSSHVGTHHHPDTHTLTHTQCSPVHTHSRDAVSGGLKARCKEHSSLPLQLSHGQRLACTHRRRSRTWLHQSMCVYARACVRCAIAAPFQQDVLCPSRQSSKTNASLPLQLCHGRHGTCLQEVCTRVCVGGGGERERERERECACVRLCV